MKMSPSTHNKLIDNSSTVLHRPRTDSGTTAVASHHLYLLTCLSDAVDRVFIYKPCLCSLMNELMFHFTGVLKITLINVDGLENYAFMRFPSFCTIIFLNSYEI